jgi:hypothetical protein
MQKRNFSDYFYLHLSQSIEEHFHRSDCFIINRAVKSEIISRKEQIWTKRSERAKLLSSRAYTSIATELRDCVEN